MSVSNCGQNSRLIGIKLNASLCTNNSTPHIYYIYTSSFDSICNVLLCTTNIIITAESLYFNYKSNIKLMHCCCRRQRASFGGNTEQEKSLAKANETFLYYFHFNIIIVIISSNAIRSNAPFGLLACAHWKTYEPSSRAPYTKK